MDLGTTFGFMDLVIIAGGIYVLYGWYLLVIKGEMKQGLIIPQSLSPKKCKDPEGFKQYMGPRTLVFGLVTVINGLLGLYQDFIAPINQIVYIASYVLFVAAIVWYIIATKKGQKRFF